MNKEFALKSSFRSESRSAEAHPLVLAARSRGEIIEPLTIFSTDGGKQLKYLSPKAMYKASKVVDCPTKYVSRS
jgi:hypothetical protein